MYPVEHVLPMNNALGEGPLWNVAEQALYWVDITGEKFFRYEPATAALETHPLPYMPGCLAFIEGGGLLLAIAEGLGVWQQGELTMLKDSPLYRPANRFNDGAADRQGRFWVGTSSNAPENALYRLDPDGSVHTMETGVGISNGIGWSPDNTIMYYSDSGGDGIVYAYNFDAATGAISNRRTFLPPTGVAATADGLTVDSEGNVWIAFWNGWKVACYDPAGQLVTEIAMPVQRPTSCAFGGPELNELYVTSAGEKLDRSQQPQTGDLFKIITDVQGLPEPYVRLALPGE